MTISKPIDHQDPIEATQPGLVQSQTDFMSFSEDKFRQDLIYYAFLITSAKYLGTAYLPKRFSKED